MNKTAINKIAIYRGPAAVRAISKPLRISIAWEKMLL